MEIILISEWLTGIEIIIGDAFHSNHPEPYGPSSRARAGGASLLEDEDNHQDNVLSMKNSGGSFRSLLHVNVG